MATFIGDIELLSNQIRELRGTGFEDNMLSSKLLGIFQQLMIIFKQCGRELAKLSRLFKTRKSGHWMKSVSFVSDALSFCQMVQESLNLYQ